MFKVVREEPQGPVIKVIGVGGAGGNAIRHMIGKVEGVDFYCANTDVQDLRKLDESITCIQIGANTTKGLGAGTDPEIGRAAAEEDRQRIGEYLHGADMLFIAAGMGGGTGTGAAPVIAEIAKEQNILTVAVVTKPFLHENRMEVAGQGLAELSTYVDTAITVANDKLLKVLGPNASLVDAFSAADDVLLGAVQGIADLITRPGVVNVDFADVRAIMLGKGHAMMGTGTATGEDRAQQATKNAVESPLLEDIAPNSAKGLLVNITASKSLGIDEFQQIGTLVQSHYAAQNAKIVIGAAEDESMGDALKVTVVATGVYGANNETPFAASASVLSTPVSPVTMHPAYQQNSLPQKPAAFQPPPPAPIVQPAPIVPPVHPALMQAPVPNQLPVEKPAEAPSTEPNDEVLDWESLRRPSFLRNQPTH